MTALKNIGVKKRSAALRVKGPDSFRFLNGMLTQDIQKISEQIPSASRAFFLTNKGKIIAPLNCVSINPEELLLWTDESAFEDLKQGLDRYIIADKVVLEPLGNLNSWTLPESDFKFEILKTRHPLGLEKIFTTTLKNNIHLVPQARLSPTHAEVLDLNQNFQATEISKEDYLQRCQETGNPEWGIDLFKDDFFLEFPLSDSVSFDKGCYVGQETVARGTFRGKVNKSYASVVSDKELVSGELTTEAGEKIGVLRHCAGNKATGIIKFDIPKTEAFLINGDKYNLRIEHHVNEETFKKGR